MDIHREIDDVARRMTATEPSASLRAPVLERLDGSRAAAPWRPPTMALVATLVLAGGGATMWLTFVPSPDHMAQRELTPQPKEVVVETTPSTVIDTASLPARPTRRGRVAEMRHDERAWDANAVSTLTPSSAIVLTDIQPIRLEIPLLAVTPLATEPLTVDPLEPVVGGQTNERTGRSM